ncbi:pore-forming ESAT-6 family protein [Streptomonospora sp. DSM 45055]|uniref:Pore-forming ESAT-6 family protein n=2 Tax=Streptomonospora wellingtoniae TaxID=3075544 RepID=A0ABU2KY94_9ACTN|nr:pore-forming ESAT-6 family protein [Streptomonospora sp. DSM 45055]MDT0304230.1 pore-forming ESAT-6 family protein [Streptomonospora sp. DSM 45055]
MSMGRNSYDLGASGEAQTNIHAVMTRLESLIGEHQGDVTSAMADFIADGVDEEYNAKEQKWHDAAQEVREIIRLVRTTLENNDETAQTSLSRASTAVQSI